MNLLDFYVTAILEETHGIAYELFNLTREQAEFEEKKSPGWNGRLFRPAVKQTYEYDCYGVKSVSSKVFLEGESPYYVGYKGLC